MKDTIANKILSFLKRNPRYSYNAPTIFKYLHGQVDINTIRSNLRRLDERGFISRETRGFYRIKLDSESLYYIENPPTLLHGIMISMEKLQKGIDGIPASSDQLFKDLGLFGFELRGNNKFVKRIYYDDDVDRLITLTFHVGVGRLDEYINCSNHPLNYFEFRDILGFIKGKVDFLGPFVNKRIVQFGMNKDYREIRMEGVSNLSLRGFLDSWFRVYNKESRGVTRVEQHVRCSVPIEVLCGLFERMFLPQPINSNVRPDEGRDVV